MITAREYFISNTDFKRTTSTKKTIVSINNKLWKKEVYNPVAKGRVMELINNE